MSACTAFSSASALGAGVHVASAGPRLLTQAVCKRFSRDRDEKLNREVSLRRNNDSSTLPSGFNCCAIGLGGCVFTQPGPGTDISDDRIRASATAVVGLLDGAVASYRFGVAIYAVNGPRETLHLRQIVTTKNELMQRPVAAIIDGRRKLPVRSNPYPAATGPTV